MPPQAERKGPPKIQLMLDSGAFSAWKRGIEINLEEYCAYIIKHEHLLAHYVCLDQIPGKPGQKRTQVEVDDAAEQSYKNQQTMKRKGLTPIPVFHQGERFKWLDRYIDDGEPYIGISPSADLPKPVYTAWLDEVFDRITDKDGWPIVKTHGFGVASFDLLKRYPWHTADATSWALTAAYGSIYVPLFRGGKPDYAQAPAKFTVSNADRKSAETPADHCSRLGPIERQQMQVFLDEVGITLEDAAKDYEVRARAIVYFMKRFEEAIGEKPFRRMGTGGFF